MKQAPKAAQQSNKEQKGKNLLKQLILSKTFMFAILALLQIVVFLFIIKYFTDSGGTAYYIITLISVAVLIAVLEQDELNPAYKLMWIIIIVIMPVTGTVFYLLWGHRTVPRRKQRLFLDIDKRANSACTQDPRVLAALKQHNPYLGLSADYLLKQGAAPVYAGNEVEYFTIGEEFFPVFLSTIKKAKKYIYMEYYIYEDGYMLDTTCEILRQKVAEGVDVRVMIDGFGSLFKLPPSYRKKMESWGIKVQEFAPIEFTVHLSDYAMLNHRDHRKVTVVDGIYGFSGGLNFADEYINRVERFGLWKDTSFLIKGPAVYNMVVMFLRNWDQCNNTESDYESYRLPAPALPQEEISFEKGFVQPYCDSPLDNENISENAYLNIIHQATDYVYICTPYLILDNEVITSLTLAAKSGVDVRILTPGIPDKKTVFLVTQSYYPVLLKAGVRIFEYTPGFNHGKMYVSDDHVAIVGSANMDYRSLYLHFENCVSFYGGGIVGEVKQDMLNCFDVSKEITLDDTTKLPLPRRLLQIIARFFAPMI